MTLDQVEIGQKVKTLSEFSGVPKYSIGYIIETYDHGRAVTVAWDLKDRPYPNNMLPEEVAELPAVNPRCPLRDGFSQDELFYLEVLE